MVRDTYDVGQNLISGYRCFSQARIVVLASEGVHEIRVVNEVKGAVSRIERDVADILMPVLTDDGL